MISIHIEDRISSESISDGFRLRSNSNLSLFMDAICRRRKKNSLLKLTILRFTVSLDINECIETPSVCQQLCENTPGKVDFK